MIDYSELIKRLVDNTISLKEKMILQKWVESSEHNKELFIDLVKRHANHKKNSFNPDKAYAKFFNTISNRKQKSFKINTLYKYAAILIVAVSIGVYYTTINPDDNKVKIVNDTSKSAESQINKDQIVITLSDGTTKVIGSKNQNVYDRNGNTIGNYANNKFSLKGVANQAELAYNEIYVPKGKTFKLELSDGTIVWLNSDTHFKFPQNFNLHKEDNRTVTLDGEAFFDVVKNKKKPFIVSSQELKIEVLGTKFNVSSYLNDVTIATTLVEGSVNVFETNMPNEKIKLKPDYQANFRKDNKHFSKNRVDTRLFTSWIENKLIIDHLKFEDILKRLERKYDVTFNNKAKDLNKEIFNGEFLDESIETVMKIIALSKPFNYKIEGNMITITNK